MGGKGRPFQKGQSGNPNGRPALPQDIRALRAASTEEITRTATRLIKLTHKELLALIANPTTPALELAVAAVLGKAIELGDAGRLEAVLCRIAGPVPKAVELTGKDGEPLRPFAGASSDELVAALLTVQRQLRSQKCRQSLPPSAGSSPRSSARGSRSES